MLRVVRAVGTRAAPRTQRLVRGLAVDGKIPTDAEQQYGPRKHELELEAKGEIAFNRDPIVPPPEQGTKANPILVPSAFAERVVGYEDPDVGQLVWFTLAKDKIHYVPDIDLYFKLYPVA
mmetsp:Transcript_355/g.1086  ORF Transcript_355/g.1086 Transcript_355/m.1086 type:complete len:120 (-) Transcript_355:180-539(-)